MPALSIGTDWSVDRHAHGCWWGRGYRDRWTLAALLDSAGLQHADRRAFFDQENGPITHGELRRRAGRLRATIQAAAGPDSQTVACLASLGASWCTAIHAIFTSGLAYAALEPEAPDARTQMCLEDCSADIIVTDANSREKAERLADGRRAVILIEDAIQGPDGPAAATVSPESTAAYVFTSGSTGRPKAVVRSHRSFAHAIYCFAENYQYRPQDIMLYPGSPGHIGSLNDALMCMLTGLESIPLDISGLDLGRICRLLEERRVTVMPMPPSVLRLLLRVMAESGRDINLRAIVASGEALLRSDIGLLFELLGTRTAIWQNYGSTETGPMYAGSYRPEDAAGSGPLPLRRPHHGCAIEIVNDEFEPLPPGTVGNLIVRSKYLADGYLNAPPDQIARFRSDERGRFFCIGDRGHMSESGELFIAGRGDRQVKIHGRRLELGDVESAIMSNHQWAEAAVVLAPAASGLSSLVAVVRAAPGQNPDPARLRGDLESFLPAAAIPHRFIRVDRMPRTTTGKLDLAAVARLAKESVGAVPTQTGGPTIGLAEAWIADCWEYVLRIQRPGREDRFQELGGDSLAAIELALMLESRFGVRLSLDRFAELQTIASQAAALQQTDHRSTKPVAGLRKDGQGPVCLLIPGIGGHAWVFAELCRQLAGPCDALGLSLVDIERSAGRSLSRETFNEAAQSALDGLGPARPVVIGGFSFGCIIAASIAAALRGRGVSVRRLLLIDPSPLDPANPSIRIRRALRSTRRLLLPKSVARSPAASLLEEELVKMEREVGGLYLGRLALAPEIPTSILTSAGLAETLSKRRSIFERDLASIDVSTLPCGHVDLLRVPNVAESAKWLDDQLARAAAA